MVEDATPKACRRHALGRAGHRRGPASVLLALTARLQAGRLERWVFRGVRRIGQAMPGVLRAKIHARHRRVKASPDPAQLQRRRSRANLTSATIHPTVKEVARIAAWS